MNSLFEFIQANRPLVDAAHALSSIVNLVGWSLGFILLFGAWRRNAIRAVSVGPINFQMQAAAVEAAATAARDWQAKVPSQQIDLPRIRKTVGKAFTPQASENLIGKSILWVDDNPINNELAVRALRRLQLDVEQVTSTDAALMAFQRRHYDLVISDMGRGEDMRAGYDLLLKMQQTGIERPFLIFASLDKPEFRREAEERGAQLSTNDMLELIDSQSDEVATLLRDLVAETVS